MAGKIVPKRRDVKSDDPRPTDRHERAKDFLSEQEVRQLLKAAKKGCYGTRDFLLLMMMYRHGLRVSEVIRLRRADIDIKAARIWVRRLRNGLSIEHPIASDEVGAIEHYLATRADSLPWLFLSERGQPMTRQSVNHLIKMAARRAKFSVAYPNLLRHACGFHLANRGCDLRLIQGHLGHRHPKCIAHYTSATRSGPQKDEPRPANSPGSEPSLGSTHGTAKNVHNLES